MAKAAKSIETSVTIPALVRHTVKVRIIGATPLFMNRMAAKARQTLFLGGAKKTAAERAELKHDPYAEFRDAAHVIHGEKGPTLVGFPVIGLKAAMAEAALETAGVKKSSVQRLIFLPGEMTAIYGTPKGVTVNVDAPAYVVPLDDREKGGHRPLSVVGPDEMKRQALHDFTAWKGSYALVIATFGLDAEVNKLVAKLQS